MSDNKEKKTAQDRSMVSGEEDYEIAYLAQKFGVEPSIVRKALSEVGQNRKDVEDFLTAYKRGEPF